MTVRILPRLLARLVVAATLVASGVRADDDGMLLRQDNGLRGSAAAGEEGPLFIAADSLRSDEADVTLAEGRVEARRSGENFFADWLRYDRNTGALSARGNVRIEQPLVVLTGDALELKVDAYTGTLTEPAFRLMGRPDNVSGRGVNGRGDAKLATLSNRDNVTLTDARYTTCPVDNDDWYLKVGTLDLDRSREVGSARDVRLEFLGTPILYAPFVDFPLNASRKSGLLAPTIGTTERSGLDVVVPYYFNLAPNYDATLTPRLLTRRGAQLGAEFRHITANSAGEIKGEYLPNDKVADRSRWSVSLEQSLKVSERAQLGVNFARVSDDDYFRDLSNLVSFTSITHLNRELYGSYVGDGWGASFQAQRYQTLQDPDAPLVEPYARLPSVRVRAERVLAGAVNLDFSSELTRFDHPTLVSGDRAWVYPTLTLPMVASYGFVTPKVGVHSTRYRLDDEFIPGGRTDISRNIPIVSVDAGVYLDRPFAFMGRDYQQSLEPRVYFVYAGREDQDDIPVFDTALLDFSYAQIFNENQFVGADRINDANQLTLAFTSRFVEDATAFERLRLTVGQRFYFDEQTVTLPGDAPRSSNATDLLLAASARFTNAWQVETAFQVNTESGVTVRRNLSASYRPAPGRTLNFGYRFIDQSTEQLDFSAQWPLAARWYGMFRANYSLRDDQLVEGVAGIEYNGGCWVARGAIQRIATRQNQSTDALFIQLELNGLGRLGSNPLDVLKDSIPGYLTSHEISPP